MAGVSSSIGSMAFTTPVVALCFGYVSLISPVTNLLTLWAVSAAFTFGYAAVLLGLVFAAAWRFGRLARGLAGPVYFLLRKSSGRTALFGCVYCGPAYRLVAGFRLFCLRPVLAAEG